MSNFWSACFKVSGGSAKTCIHLVFEETAHNDIDYWIRYWWYPYKILKNFNWKVFFALFSNLTIVMNFKYPQAFADKFFNQFGRVPLE